MDQAQTTGFQVARFASTGALNTVVDLVVFNLPYHRQTRRDGGPGWTSTMVLISFMTGTQLIESLHGIEATATEAAPEGNSNERMAA